MAEYVGGEPMAVSVGDPITFENKTDDCFSVDVGIVFRKSGLYRVTVDGKHTSVEIEPERKTGRWLELYAHEDGERDGVWCSECREHYYFGGQLMNFCPNCGADMRGGQDDT